MPDFVQGGKVDGKGVKPTQNVTRAIEYRMDETICSRAVCPSDFEHLIDGGAVDPMSRDHDLGVYRRVSMFYPALRCLREEALSESNGKGSD